MQKKLYSPVTVMVNIIHVVHRYKSQFNSCPYYMSCDAAKFN